MPARSSPQLGDIFTIHAAGRRMTFVAHPRDYKQFFHNSHASFQAAVQPFTMKAGTQEKTSFVHTYTLSLCLSHTHPGGLSTASFFQHHSDIHDAIKGKLVPTYLTKLCPILSRGQSIVCSFPNAHYCRGHSILTDAPVYTKMYISSSP